MVLIFLMKMLCNTMVGRVQDQGPAKKDTSNQKGVKRCHSMSQSEGESDGEISESECPDWLAMWSKCKETSLPTCLELRQKQHKMTSQILTLINTISSLKSSLTGRMRPWWRLMNTLQTYSTPTSVGLWLRSTWRRYGLAHTTWLQCPKPTLKSI